MDSVVRTQQHAQADADYVQSAAEAIATLLNGQPAISRAEAIGRFQAANDIIWSAELYQRICAALDKLCDTGIRLRRDLSDPLTQAFTAVGWSVRFKRNMEIQAEGEPAEYFYQVEAGAVRTYKLLDDGRRQVVTFHLPGDVIELEASPDYRLSAAAVASSALRVARRSAIIAMAQRSPGLATEIWRRTASHLKLVQDQLLALGRKKADERLASFLLQMADRSMSDPVVELPMSSAGHCRLSRPHRRNGRPQLHPAGEHLHHSQARPAPRSNLQSLCAAGPAWLI